MKKEHTGRGFTIFRFEDRNGIECTLQKSSIATEDCIWLGAKDLGIQEFIAYQGWKSRPEFDESTIEHHFVGNNRMHLTQKQVKALIPHLQKFVETGEL